jgi:predicted metal-dependent hydrolase
MGHITLGGPAGSNLDARMEPTSSYQKRPHFLVPDLPLPAYTFIPGRTPHPIRDPAGHMHGQQVQPPEPLDPARWRENRAYLHGIDLFNSGYYWEAHEAWEGLWHRAGRRGPVAEFLKGLIKLAAAGVKVREGIPRGVAAHAAGAAEHFQQTAEVFGGTEASFAGLRLEELLRLAAEAGHLAPGVAAEADNGVRVVFPFPLRPGP